MSRKKLYDDQAIFTRDGYRCWHCGTSRDLTVHHRINRGMGGSKTPRLNAPSNLITICATFNGQMESHATLAELARIQGWKLYRTQDPLSEAVFDAQAVQWFWLDDDHNRLSSRPVAG